jgi:hypothetical protein
MRSRATAPLISTQAHPAVRELEAAIEEDFSADEMEAVKRWLVATAERLQRTTAAKGPGRRE